MDEDDLDNETEEERCAQVGLTRRQMTLTFHNVHSGCGVTRGHVVPTASVQFRVKAPMM